MTLKARLKQSGNTNNYTIEKIYITILFKNYIVSRIFSTSAVLSSPLIIL